MRVGSIYSLCSIPSPFPTFSHTLHSLCRKRRSGPALQPLRCLPGVRHTGPTGSTQTKKFHVPLPSQSVIPTSTHPADHGGYLRRENPHLTFSQLLRAAAAEWRRLPKAERSTWDAKAKEVRLFVCCALHPFSADTLYGSFSHFPSLCRRVDAALYSAIATQEKSPQPPRTLFVVRLKMYVWAPRRVCISHSWFIDRARRERAFLTICTTPIRSPRPPFFFAKAERRKEAQLKAAMQQGMGLGHSGLGHAGLGHSALAHAGLGHAGLGHPGLGGQHPVRASR